MSSDDRKAYAQGDIRPSREPGGQEGRPQREQTTQEKRKRKRRHDQNKSEDNKDALRRYHTDYKRNRKMIKRREEYRKDPDRYERRAPRKYERPDKTAVAQRFGRVIEGGPRPVMVWDGEDFEGDPWALARSVGVNVLSNKDFRAGYTVDGVLVAALFDSSDRDGYEFDIVVHPDWQRKRLGSELMDVALDLYEQNSEAYGEDYALNMDVISPVAQRMLADRGLVEVGREGGHVLMTRLSHQRLKTAVAQRHAARLWYHGSPDRFEGFQTYEGHTFGKGPSEVPLFFSPSKSFAKMYATGPEGTVYAARLKWRKVFDSENLYRESRYWPPEYEDLTPEGKALYDDLADGKVFPGVDEDDLLDGYPSLWAQVLRMDYDIIEDSAFKRWLKKNGYDAAYVTGDGEQNVFVFSPSQVEIVEVESMRGKQASRRIRKSFVLNRIYDHIHDREGIEEGSAHVISEWGSHEWLVSYLTYAGDVRKVLVGGYNTDDGVFLSVRPFRFRSAGDVMLYDQHNPANNEIKQPGLDVNYRAEGPTTYSTEPDEKKGVVPGNRVPSRQMDGVPPASSRVIPDSMKETLQQEYMKSAAATVPQILSNCGPEVTGRSRDLKYKRKRLSPSGMSTWIAQSVTDPGKQYTIKVKPIRKDKRRKIVSKMPVRVSCSCPFWRWQGPEHWGVVNDYLYGKPRGTASFPIVRDPKSKHWACKHVIAVLKLVQKHRYSSKADSQWSYDGPLAPLPDEGRVAARYMEAKRQLWWHGTSGKNLRSILKQGLIPTGDLVYDVEIDQNRGGGRSIKTFGGIYFSSQWFTAYSAAGQANPGRRMPRVVIGATLDNRSPDVLLDEDDMLQGIENVMGRTFDEVARQIRLPEGSVDSWGTPRVGAYGTINRFLLEDADYGDLPSLYLDRMVSMYPKLEGRVKRQREALESAIRDLLAGYAAHLLEVRYHRNKDHHTKEIQESIESIPSVSYYSEDEKRDTIKVYEEQLKQHLADERKIKGSFQLLQKATNRLGEMMREATEMPEGAWRHNIRVMRPVTYRGKDRILMVASIEDGTSQVWRDAGHTPYTADIIFHYGAQHRKPFLDKYEERVGGIARVLDASGKVLEILDPFGDLEERGWPTDIWGPAPRAYRDVAASDLTSDRLSRRPSSKDDHGER